MYGYFIFILISIFIYFILFKTPFFISNMIFKFSSLNNIVLNYILTKDNKNYLINSFRFKHTKHDGKLVSNILKTNKLKMSCSRLMLKELKDPIILHKEHNIVKKYLEIESDSQSQSKFVYLNEYSNFVNICTNLLKYILNNKSKNKTNINISIIVNHRTKNNFDYGNYITFAFLIVNNIMSYKEIADLISKSIKNAKSGSKKTYTLYDCLKLYNCDLILNSWRDLSTINNINDFKLTRYEPHILTLNEIKDFLFSNKKRKIVYFDYFNSNYVINRLDYLKISMQL
jgi:hypothetical protein